MPLLSDRQLPEDHYIRGSFSDNLFNIRNFNTKAANGQVAFSGGEPGHAGIVFLQANKYRASRDISLASIRLPGGISVVGNSEYTRYDLDIVLRGDSDNPIQDYTGCRLVWGFLDNLDAPYSVTGTNKNTNVTYTITGNPRNGAYFEVDINRYGDEYIRTVVSTGDLQTVNNRAVKSAQYLNSKFRNYRIITTHSVSSGIVIVDFMLDDYELSRYTIPATDFDYSMATNPISGSKSRLADLMSPGLILKGSPAQPRNSFLYLDYIKYKWQHEPHENLPQITRYG